MTVQKGGKVRFEKVERKVRNHFSSVIQLTKVRKKTIFYFIFRNNYIILWHGEARVVYAKSAETLSDG